MDKKFLIKKLLTKKNKDYTYAIAFFLIFSFFIFFVIRPNLLSVFEANSKIDSLKKLKFLYDEQIDKIIELQMTLEEGRENLVLLNQAVATKPEVNKILSDLDVSSNEGGLARSNIEVSDINLKEKENSDKLKSFGVHIDFSGGFPDSLALIKKVYNQRRLKTISNLLITKDEKESSESSQLKISMEILGYFFFNDGSIVKY